MFMLLLLNVLNWFIMIIGIKRLLLLGNLDRGKLKLIRNVSDLLRTILNAIIAIHHQVCRKP
jgi:hypothetical protein